MSAKQTHLRTHGAGLLLRIGFFHGLADAMTSRSDTAGEAMPNTEATALEALGDALSAFGNAPVAVEATLRALVTSLERS